MSHCDTEIIKWNEEAQAVLERRADWTHTESYDDVFSKVPKLKPIHAFFDGIGEPGITVLDYAPRFANPARKIP